MLEAQDKFAKSEQTNDHQLNALQSEASTELSSPPGAATPRAGGRTNSIFTVDSGVSQAQSRHAEAIFNALPSGMQQALLDGNVNIELAAGWRQGQPQGENNATRGMVYVDSGMTDQALVHELYEMAGQISPTTLKGSWNDAQAVSIADDATEKILNGQGTNPGDLNDTLSEVNFANGFQDDRSVQGDGDLMSNVFTADFFATNPSLYQDRVGSKVMQVSVDDTPELADYIARVTGMTSAASVRSPFGSRSQSESDPPILMLRY